MIGAGPRLAAARIEPAVGSTFDAVRPEGFATAVCGEDLPPVLFGDAGRDQQHGEAGQVRGREQPELLGRLDERDTVEVCGAEPIGAAGWTGLVAAALVADLQRRLQLGADQQEPVGQQPSGSDGNRTTLRVEDRLAPLGGVDHVGPVGQHLRRGAPLLRRGVWVSERGLGGRKLVG